MRKGFRVNARCGVLLCVWAGVGGLWGVEMGLRPEGVGQEGGWKVELSRMGFEAPVEELEKGEVVGQKWMISGGEGIFSG